MADGGKRKVGNLPRPEAGVGRPVIPHDQKPKGRSRIGSMPGATPGASRKVGSLAESAQRPKECDCAGTLERGLYKHQAKCPRTVVLHYAHNYRRTSWTDPATQCCPYQCEGTVLTMGVTHRWDCPFWDDTEEVPFGWHFTQSVLGRAQPLVDEPDDNPLDALDDPTFDLPF